MMQSQQPHRPQVLIIGLDGGDIDLINDGWPVSGQLPTFKHLNGYRDSGNLESTIPPITLRRPGPHS